METKVQLGDMVDVMAVAKTYPPNSYEINGKYYLDYYTDIAGDMFVKNISSTMKDGHYFTVNLEEPKNDADKILRTAFGKMRIWKLA